MLLAFIAVTLIIWYVRDRRREIERQKQQTTSRAERQATLEAAAQQVEFQAELGRDLVRRMEVIDVPPTLRVSVSDVITELDGVAADLRSCQAPLITHRRLINW